MSGKVTALSMAEGSPDFKMDVSIVFGGNVERHCILRTTFDRLGVWRAKYGGFGISPFEDSNGVMKKEAAIIENEVWVFGIDSTKPDDIVASVQIASKWFDLPASDFLKDIYVKNLNAESEDVMSAKALIDANKKLYKGVSEAIKIAAAKLAIRGEVNLWVISSNLNYKIPKSDLHSSLRDGGADMVGVAKNQYLIKSGSNDGNRSDKIKTNLHLAKFFI